MLTEDGQRKKEENVWLEPLLYHARGPGMGRTAGSSEAPEIDKLVKRTNTMHRDQNRNATQTKLVKQSEEKQYWENNTIARYHFS